MIRVMIVMLAATILGACGLFDDNSGPGDTGGTLVAGDIPDPPYAGDSLIETKIIKHDVVVRATMTSYSSEVVVNPEARFGDYEVSLRFNLAVSEYLKGTGPSNIVALWFHGDSYETRAEAEVSLRARLRERDAQWDDREAVFFLYSEPSGFGPLRDEQFQAPDHFLLSYGDLFRVNDRYSLHSTTNRKWLPAAGTSPTGDSQEFLLAVPPPTETITLGELKRKIAEVTAELAGGDGSERYKRCVREKYRHIQNQRNWLEVFGSIFTLWNIEHSLVSGLPAGTVLDNQEGWNFLDPNDRELSWLDGRDSGLFALVDEPSTSVDEDGDGDYDYVTFDRMVQVARPLPAGEYRFDLKEPLRQYVSCGFVVSNEWTVAAAAPEGVVHEALFDPVTDGSAVAADSTNGVLEPTTFIDAGAATSVDRIAWEAGTAKLKYSSRTALAGRVVDFIELDGTVSLSLPIDSAAVDAVNNTLSWSVPSQPWEDGDKLMLRIRGVP